MMLKYPQMPFNGVLFGSGVIEAKEAHTKFSLGPPWSVIRSGAF